MIPAAVFVVALAVRLLHLWFIRDTPFFDVLLGDARAYDAWAARLAAGDWWSGEVFYQAPLYPYFLGVLYTVFGRDLVMVRVVQALVGAGACALLSSAAARLFGPRVGLVAGLALALYAPAIFFDGLLQKSVLDIFFVCLTIWLVSGLQRPRATPLGWLWLGLALGALSLTRENALVFVAVALCWAMLRGAASFGRARATPVVLLLVGLAVVLVPVATRNYAVGGGFYLTTAQFGPNFFIGNNPQSDGTYMSLRPGRGAPEYERQDATELAEHALQRRLTPAEVSGYWTDRALTFITSQPTAWLALTARKVALLWNASEMVDTESQESYAEFSWPLRVLGPVGHFGVLVPLAVVGLWATWADRRRLWPLYAMLAAYAASVVIFYVFARYRYPLAPFLVLFAAAGVVALPTWLRHWPRSRLATTATTAITVTALALVTAIVNWPMLSTTTMRAITETNLGTALQELGRVDEARDRYARAIAIRPDYAPAYNNLGVALRAQGRVDEAIASYHAGLQRQQHYPDLHYNLANALLQQHRAAEAAAHLRIALATIPASVEARTNLAVAMAEDGRVDEAIVELRAVLTRDPGAVQAHRNLGNLLAAKGQLQEAVVHTERAIALEPSAAAYYDLGSLLLEGQRFGAAATAFRASLRLDASVADTHNNLGIALASQGLMPEAVKEFEAALALQPTLAGARRNLEMARAQRK